MVELERFKRQIQDRGLESLHKYYGIYRGVVADNQDPEKKGRVMLQIPQIYGTDTHDYWASSFGILLNNEQTQISVPAIGAVVWVVFEGGNPYYPIWTYGNGITNNISENYSKLNNSGAVYTVKGSTGFVLDETSNSIEFLVQNKRVGELLESKLTFSPNEKESVVISENSVQLGGAQAIEPILLGQSTVLVLTELITAISNLALQCSLLTIVAPLTPPVNAPAFAAIQAQLVAIIPRLETLKSQFSSTK